MDPEVPPPGAGVATVICAVAAAATSAAEMAAVSCVALRNVVERAAPFQRTVEPLTKPPPFTRRVSGPVPTVAPVGISPVSPGAGLVTVKASGAGVATVTGAIAAVARSEAGMAAVSWVALTKVVVRAAPFQRTPEALTKLLPFTVSVNAAPPTLALEGESDVSDGAGVVIVNVWAPDVPPSTPGIVTVTWALPAAAISEAGIAAATCVGLTRVAGRAARFQRTLLPLTKPVPVTVSVNAAPLTSALLGLRPVSVGAGLFTLNVCAAEVPPPGAGVRTVTLAVPAAAMSAAVIAAVSWRGL